MEPNDDDDDPSDFSQTHNNNRSIASPIQEKHTECEAAERIHLNSFESDKDKGCQNADIATHRLPLPDLVTGTHSHRALRIHLQQLRAF